MAKRKIIAAAALTILLTAIIASCDRDTATGDAVADSQTGEVEAEDAGGQAMPDLPDMDFGGKAYRALGRYHATYAQFINFEIEAEEITGEPVNDAVYNRNRRLEDKYSVVIEQTLRDDPAGTLQKAVKAGDDEYSLAFITQDRIGALATAGIFCDLNSLKYLDFDKPWWSGEVNKAISVGNKLYFTTSDFNMMDKNRTYLLMYNKDMAQSYGLGNLYGLVYENKWTVDKMRELCRAVSGDIDGDGVMTDADRWGFGMDSYNAFYAFFGSCDNYMITKNADDYPVLSINNERTISSIDKILALTNDKTTSFYCQDFQGKVPYDFWYASAIVFTEGRELFTAFFTHMLQYVAQSETTVDYGILPFPKYDENQKNYISGTDYEHAALFAVPASVQDIDFAAFMLEALSAASKYEVMPYYYEVSTKTKYTYDEESPKMLDIIFEGLRYDLGCIYNWGGIREIFNRTIAPRGENSFVSSYEKLEEKILSEMEKTVGVFDEIK